MIRRSRIATVVASLAALSLAAPPAMASHRWDWHRYRHRDRIDGGDVIAGILILGGIAAVASAASKAGKDKSRERDYRYRDGSDRDGSYRDEPYRDTDADARNRDGAGADYADGSADSGKEWRDGNSRNDSSEWADSESLNSAVDRCVDEVSRGSARIDDIESANRDGDGWRIEGRMDGGGEFACTVDKDGRIRNVNIDGRAI